jgi:LmbE family N-acetylglucosaminyl deacetylase
MAKRILVLCAHPDDHILGVGGAMAKFAKEGYDVVTVIFSLGEFSHPHLKPDVVARMRKEESERADKVIGGTQLIILGLRETHFAQDAKRKRVKTRLIRLFNRLRAEKIFVHSDKDYHPHHRLVNKIACESMSSAQAKSELYSYDILRLGGRPRKARLVIDTSGYHAVKQRALQCFKSQFRLFSHLTVFLTPLLILTAIRDHFNGLRFGKRTAEVFYRIA